VLSKIICARRALRRGVASRHRARAMHHPRPPAGRGSPFPMRCTLRLLGVLQGPRAPRHAVPARGSPRTTGPSAAPRRTRAGLGSCATAASLSSPRCHRGGLAYKKQAPSPPFESHTEPPAAIAVLPLNSPARSYSQLANHLNLLPRTPRGVRRRLFARYCAPSLEPRTPRQSPPATTVRRRQVPLAQTPSIHGP
jgi:hypothetical protein